MKRTLFAMFTAVALGGATMAAPPGRPPPPPASPSLPPLPPLPPQPPPPRHDSVVSPSAEIDVQHPVTLRVDVVCMDVDVVAGPPSKVRAKLVEGPGGVQLVQSGDRVDVRLVTDRARVPGGMEGKLRVELPPGSRADLTSSSGDITVRDVAGNVRVRTTSGGVRLTRVANIEVTSVSGDVVADAVSGEARVRTVSGDAHITHAGAAPDGAVEFGTTSGDLVWAGACGAGCRIDTRSISGGVKLMFAPSSSFELRFVSHSGELLDQLKLGSLERQSERPGGSKRARYGKGEGIVEVQTFSGDLQVAKR